MDTASTMLQVLGKQEGDAFDQLLVQLSQIHHAEVQTLRTKLSQADDARGQRSGKHADRRKVTSIDGGDPVVGDIDHVDLEFLGGAGGQKLTTSEVGSLLEGTNLLPGSQHQWAARLEKVCLSLSGQMDRLLDQSSPSAHPRALATAAMQLALPVEVHPATVHHHALPSHKDHEYSHVEKSDLDILDAESEAAEACFPSGEDPGGKSDTKTDNDEDEYLPPVKMDGLFASTFDTPDYHLDANLYHVEDFYYTDGFAQKVARSEPFQSIVLFFICVNGLVIGIEVDAEPEPDDEWPFTIAAHLFCFVFLAELLVRFFAFQMKRNCMKDGWFRFDSVLVVLAVLETWMLPVLIGDIIELPLAPLRLLRLMRLTRMVRLMQFFPELVTLVRGMLRASRATASSLMLIMLLLYVYAIVLRLVLKGQQPPALYAKNRDFTTLPRCMWTIFVDLTLMDSPANLLTSFVFADTPAVIFAGILLTMFMVISALMIINMLIGCMCEVVSAEAQNERNEHAIRQLKETLLTNLQEFDDGDGVLTEEELAAVMSDSRSNHVLQALKIDRLFLSELQSMLFSRHVTKVPIKGIMELMFLCRGDLPTTVQHMARAQAFLSTSIADVERRLLTKFDTLNVALGIAPAHPTLNRSSSLVTNQAGLNQ